ncbi:scarecrow-like protein 14 [Mercurialis annua]|uniref:scarecrow-like protein 14 n=1 Tax=Mercurialis annua TaxID=3986 RepID=UPI00215FA337|nr:scarecrow-like protein 14 [Mercurialis annua]
MDALLQEFPNSMNNFKFDHTPISYTSNRHFLNEYEPNHNHFPQPDPNYLSSYSEEHGPNDNAVLKYINDMLMEEDLEGKTCMLEDSLSLQAAEKSFYDVLGQEYPHQISNSVENSNWTQNLDLSPGKKNHHERDYLEEEERSIKQSAFGLAESEQDSEMFDKVLLCTSKNSGSESCALQTQSPTKSSNGSRGMRGRRKGNKKGSESDAVDIDLPTLLTQCAQSVSINDQRTTYELLKQIRQHSSAYGDGNQRVAHYFTDALETRLAGGSIPSYSPVLSSKTPVSDILKAYQVYVKACPFKRMSHFFANWTIFKLAEKATKLHIIDFGVLYGFQWPCLIQRLSERPGGPPKLRITGIELPQPGFRPAERVEETGRRLQRYCDRFNVPFEYHAVAQKWETIKYQNLKIDRDEMTVVNCLYRFRNLPDDTVVADSARDSVLKLIRKIKPKIFIHGVINGTYNAPFFVSRFREALFYYSSLFDMFQVNAERENEQRMLYEKAIFGRDIMNVIACEGAERVERPETYKQWQVRNMRGGFRQMELDQEILKRVRSTVRSEYHKDFVVDENGRWMLQGWKGRVISAVSVWKPV